MLNKELIDFTEEEIQETNEWFEEELLETIVKNYKFQYDCMSYFNAVLDKMYKVCTLSNASTEKDVEWYEDNDGDFWYHEIPSSCTHNGKPIVIDCRPPTYPYKEDFEGKEETIGAIYDC